MGMPPAEDALAAGVMVDAAALDVVEEVGDEFPNPLKWRPEADAMGDDTDDASEDEDEDNAEDDSENEDAEDAELVDKAIVDETRVDDPTERVDEARAEEEAERIEDADEKTRVEDGEATDDDVGVVEEAVVVAERDDVAALKSEPEAELDAVTVTNCVDTTVTVLADTGVDPIAAEEKADVVLAATDPLADEDGFDAGVS